MGFHVGKDVGYPLRSNDVKIRIYEQDITSGHSGQTVVNAFSVMETSGVAGGAFDSPVHQSEVVISEVLIFPQLIVGHNPSVRRSGIQPLGDGLIDSEEFAIFEDDGYYVQHGSAP